VRLEGLGQLKNAVISSRQAGTVENFNICEPIVEKMR
jgi:hypothetical protein